MFTIHRNLLAASTLAVGVTACTAIFSFVHPLLLNPFSYPNPAELVTIEPEKQGSRVPATLSDFEAWRQETRAFRDLAAFDIGFFFLNNAEEPEQIPGALVSTNLFHLLGVEPVLGRDFQPNEDRVVILTDAAWKRHFNADPNILGRSIALDFARTTEVERYTVIGVLPKNFWMYYAGFEVFVPLDQKAARNLYVVGRAKEGVSVAQAQSAVRSIPIEKEETARVRNWQDTAAQPIRPALIALSAASILLLLIASVNVTSLLLARANARRREIAIRAALGATPARILKLLLGESLQLALIAAAAGALLAKALVTALIKTIPPDLNSARLLPGLDRVTVDLTALLFAALIAAAACIAAQILPALELRSIDLVTGLKNAASARAPRKILVTAEVALSVVLLASAGLLLKTIAHIDDIDVGFQPKNLLVLRLPIPRGQQNAPALLKACYDAISALPGVESAALTSSQPLTGASGARVVSPNYFATLGIALRRGRFFTGSDRHRAVINEAMAHRDFPNEDPIGRTITLEGARLEIVGVAANTRSRLFEKEGPIIYRSSNDAPAGQIAVRTAADPLSLAQAVRAAVAAQGGTVAEISTMESFIKNDSWQHQQTATLTTLFAALAFLLATVGLYGVISFAVARRRKEIGIRVALGATRKNVIALVLRESLMPVGTGLAAGLALSLALNQSLKSLFCEVAPADPQILTAVVCAIALATLAASYIPTLRALRVDPAKTLREE
ncbi:MAG TPA: ADOP family duplicated permease [Bryobacteraceae bacterium]|jgi:predicted permease|nr:ADOP family duplicated permease [Bryobacteraceae bacterium]